MNRVCGFSYLQGPSPVKAIFTCVDDDGNRVIYDCELTDPIGTQEQFDELLAAGNLVARP